MGKEKTFTIAVKKTKEKVYYNVQSISKDDWISCICKQKKIN
jgi:hypothetical protein